MLDTNVLVDFVLIYWKQERKEVIPPSLVKSKYLLNLYESKKFSSIMSCWNKFELRDIIMQLKLQQKWVLSGYSVREFGDAKKEINLTISEINLVNQIVFDVWNFSRKITAILTPKDKVKIEKFNELDFSFMDILLLIQADKLNCNYFVTKDKKLLNQKKELHNKFKVTIVNVKEFLNKLEYET